MKYFRLTLAVVAILASSLCAYAQNLTVTGIVTDSSTGLGVPFAGVMIKGTTDGTVTDADGNYSITVASDGVLVFSSIGYKDSEVPVAGIAKHDVVLHPDTETIEETIVVAFGTATKESFTGSATVVKSSDIAKTQSTDVTRALEGVVAGVQMTTSSGSLGQSPSIMVRGISSMSAGTAPLYVVDGIPYSGDMNNINTADIESMTVLKDAASNALYGARGANGVIMITTKKAKRGDAVINVDAKWGLNTKALKDYDVITDPGQYYEAYYSALRNYYERPDPTRDADGNLLHNPGMTPSQAHIQALKTMSGSTNAGGLGYIVYDVPDGQSLIGTNGRLNPAATLGRVMTYNDQLYTIVPDNWIDEAYRNSLRQEYNVSISGSEEKISVLASFGYLNNKGIIDGSDMYRYTARLRADYQAKTWLKVGANLSYTNYNWDNGNTDEGSDSSSGNVFAIATSIAPIYPIYMRDGNGNIMIDKYGYRMYDYGDGSNGGLVRPYLGNSNALQGAILDRNNAEGNAFNGTGYTEIKFLKDFTFTLNAGFGIDETRSTSIMNKYYGMATSVGGMISKGHSRSFYLNLQELLNWKKTFAGVHNVSVLLGHENYSTKSYGLSAAKSQMFSMDNDELNGAVVDSKNAASSFGEYNNEGYFIRAQYDFANRIFGSVSIRRDASSRFHPDHRWGNFWSLGGGWLINHENWFPQLPWIDMLKIKASIGSQGNDSLPSNYLYTDTYTLSNNQDSPAISFGVKGNKEITWETNTNFNAGIDFDLLTGRISGTVEYFYRKTSDMLFFFTTPVSLGYSGYYDNIGDMRNSGIELSANFGLYRNQNINWNFYFNLTHYTNKITMLPEDKKTRTIEGYEGYANSLRFVGEGLPLNTFYIPKYAGVEPGTGRSMWYKDVLDENDNITGRETTTDYSEATQYLCGAPTPDLYGGFGTSLEFYGFDFSASFTYSVGGLSYDSGYANFMAPPTSRTPGTNFHKDVMKAWSPGNTGSEIPRFQFEDQYTASDSDRFLTDASYLNFQNAQLGYTLPEKITRKMHISRLRFYVACDNIIYWSHRRGFDPRFSFTGSTNSAVNSPVRTVSGGINLTF